MTRKFKNAGDVWQYAVLRMIEERGLAGLSRELAMRCEAVDISLIRIELLSNDAILLQPHIVKKLSDCISSFYPQAMISIKHGCSENPRYPSTDAKKAIATGRSAIKKMMIES